jgi:hypothetical protein
VLRGGARRLNPCSFAHCNHLDGNVGFDFSPKLLAAQYFGKSRNEAPLHIHSEIGPSENLSPYLDVYGGRFSDVEADQGCCDPVIFISLIIFDLWRSALQFDNVNSDFWPVSSIKLFASEFDALACKLGLCGSGNPESKGERGNSDGSECGKEAVVLIDQTQRASSLRPDAHALKIVD